MPLRRVTTVFFIGLTVLTVGLVLANNVPLWPQGVLLIALYGVFVTLVLVFFHRYYDRLQHFQRLYAAMREGVALRELILDADGKPWDYRYLEVNPAYERMSEFTRQQLIGKTWRELGVSEKSDWPKEYDDYVDVALRGTSRRFTRVYHGRYYEVQTYQPRPMQFAAIYTDITEQIEAERQTWENYDDWARLVTTMGDMLFIFDTAGGILHVNSAVEATLGYSAQELMGKAVSELHPEEMLQETEVNMQEVLMGRPPTRAVPLVAKDGTLIDVEIRSTRGKWRGQEAVFAVVRDVRERLLAEKRLRYLSLHDQLTDVYNRAFFSAEMERLQGSRDYPISIIMADANGLKLINDVLGHRAGDEFLRASAAVLRGVLRKADVLARVGGDEFAVILPRTGADVAGKVLERIRTASESFGAEGCVLPMSLSLGVATANDESVSLDDTYKLADHLMYRDKLAERSVAHRNILNALLQVLAERDFGALGHTARLKEFCLALGRSFDLTTKQLEALALLAEVHDLGLIGVNPTLLSSRSRLTKEEYGLIKQHSERGLRIAYTFPELAGVADFILAHHERWDGSGYPLGIRGTDIPLECRILAVADAYEVMTGGRPYREPLSPSLALAELVCCAGRQFDPDVVERFCALQV
ncbi:MAG: Cyclic di-GMP phosphodiesterase response regulator RpfG [Firmicutes bacterium]|nr:Cyclic di-GMP phosphodiesterase response regulator RpfG [candidate division NPL-UPA2 bacterium]